MASFKSNNLTKISKAIFVFFFFVTPFSCTVNKTSSHALNKFEKLDFSKCSIASEAFTSIMIEMPKGYSKKLIENEGICEYRFSYNDGSIAYVSNDVWFGSSLNFENRQLIGHESYNKNQLLDTILLQGLQSNKLNWSEHIIGDLMIGYVNASENKKSLFEDSFNTILKI